MHSSLSRMGISLRMISQPEIAPYLKTLACLACLATLDRSRTSANLMFCLNVRFHHSARTLLRLSILLRPSPFPLLAGRACNVLFCSFFCFFRSLPVHSGNHNFFLLERGLLTKVFAITTTTGCRLVIHRLTYS